MSDKETGGPAYPNAYTLPEYQGMTLRDWLAGMAMQGLLAADTEFSMGADTVAKLSYEQADKMLEASK